MNMKNLLAALLFAVSVAVPATTAAKTINAIYSVADRFNSEADIVKEDLADFDFLYFMAAPDWKSADYNAPVEEIIAKVVGSHSYGERAPIIEKLINTVHENGNKILCSFSGTDFINIATDPGQRRKFAAVTAAFAKRYGYDGVELDWEHTVTEPLHVDMMQDIRDALDALADGKRYWLTTALNSIRHYTPQQAQALCKSTDWINIMFYDMGGGIWGTEATHNSPLDKMEEIAATLWSPFPHEKLHIGLPNYGFYYKGITPGEKVAEGKKLGDYGRYCNATELPALIEAGWTEEWDDTAKCPYYHSPDKTEFMTLESHRSMDHKFDWIKEQKFGGVFWWEYTCDYVRPSQIGGGKGIHLITDHVTEKVKELNKQD